MERCRQQTLSGGLRRDDRFYSPNYVGAGKIPGFVFTHLVIISNLPGWKRPGGSQEVQHRGGSCSSEGEWTRKRSQSGLCQ